MTRGIAVLGSENRANLVDPLEVGRYTHLFRELGGLGKEYLAAQVVDLKNTGT
jgi:hypothetical protein